MNDCAFIIFPSLSPVALSPPPASHVLYTNLRGADILQQWLAKHPEVARKHQAFNEGERALADAGTDDKSTSQSGRGKSLQSRSPEQSADAGIPVELQPYRDILPPSLLPPALRRPFAVAMATGDWG